MGPMQLLDTLKLSDVISATKNKRYAFFYLYGRYDAISLQMIPRLIDDIDFLTGEIPFFTCYEQAFITNENINNLLKDEIIHTEINHDLEASLDKMAEMSVKFNCERLPALIIIDKKKSTRSNYYIMNTDNPLPEIIKVIRSIVKAPTERINTMRHKEQNDSQIELNDLLSVPLSNDKKESFIKAISRYIYKDPRDGHRLFEKHYDAYFDKGIENPKTFCCRVHISESSLSKLYAGGYTKKPGRDLLIQCAEGFGLSKKETNELLVAYGHSPVEDETISRVNEALSQKYKKGKVLLAEYFDKYLMQSQKKSISKFGIENGLSKATLSRMNDIEGDILPSRDNLIKCAIGFRLTLNETEELLTAFGYAPLYDVDIMDVKDQIIASGIEKNLSYNEIKEILECHTDDDTL